MIGLDESVFGRIKAKEILGAEPDIQSIKEMLEQEIISLTQNLEHLKTDELEHVKTKQVEIQKSIDSRPGAMALPQNKIRLFAQYSTRYIKFIEERIGSKV